MQPADAAGSGPTTWTIMMYMADNAYPELPWQQNINQMEAAALSPGNNIIALVDPYGGANTTLYRIAHDPGGMNTDIVSPEIDDGGAVIPVSTRNANMAAPVTLSSFIEFSVSAYPADYYALIMWGHGAVWYGLCPDGTDILTLPELRTALSDATVTIGRPIDIVGVDACAEATLEMLFEIHPFARYFVGSEKDIPAQGLPYRAVLDGLTDVGDVAPEQFGRSIIDEYINWARYNSTYSATMALFDLSKVPALVDEFGAWVSMGKKYDSLFHTTLQSVFENAEHYETEWQDDFGDLVAHMQSAPVPLELRMESIDVATAYSWAVLYADSYDNPDATDGVRARTPTGAVAYSPSVATPDLSYSSLQIASSGWVQLSHMLRRSDGNNASAPGPELSYSRYNVTGPGIFDAVVVTWPSAYSDLEVWVYRQQAGGLVFSGRYTSSGNSLTIHGGAAMGDLILSASAGSDGVAESYAQLGPVPIYGKVTVNLALRGLNAAVTQLHITLLTSVRSIELVVNVIGGEITVIDLLTPRDVRLGDLVEIQIEDDRGKLEGRGHLLLQTQTAGLTVSLHEVPAESSGPIVVLVMATLASMMICGFALLLLRETKKRL